VTQTHQGSLLARAAERVPSYLELLEALVVRESPSGDEARNREVADLLVREIEARGGAVERHPVVGWGDHLVARFPGEVPGERPLLVVGHMDTVHPAGTLERFPFRVEDGVIHGPGTYDMKAGVAAVLEAIGLLAALGERPRWDVVLLVTCDEEVGSGTSRGLIESLARDARAALVVEPCIAGGAVKVRRKGVGWYRLTVRGHASHAGIEPEAGASAVHELSRMVVRTLALQDLQAGTTVNVGVVGGGTRTNVVAEEAFAKVDVRFWTAEEARRVDRAMRALAPEDGRCTLEIEGGLDRAPLEQTPESDRLYQVARSEAEALGFTLAQGGTGGASDGNLTSGAGCPTLDGLGPDGAGAHSRHEHVLLADVSRRIALLAGLLRRVP